ncbi:MAG: nucleoside-diphosphate sugar epimerase/dehydratase, partial [Candidatus Latescibacterota bacterium]
MAVLGFPPAEDRIWISLFQIFLPIMVIKFFIFNFFNFKRFALYSDELYDVSKSAILISLSVAALFVVRPWFSPFSKTPVFFFFTDALFSLGAIIIFNSSFRCVYCNRATLMSLLFKRNGSRCGSKRYLIVGAGAIGQSLLQILLHHQSHKYTVAGFLDDNPELIGKQIEGIKIYGPIRDVVDIARKLQSNQLIIAMPSAPAKRTREIIDSVKETSINVSTVPSYVEIIEGNVRVDNIREIKIEDILSRDKIEIDLEMISGKVSGRNILITGAAGSIGSEICRQLLRFNPSVLVALDQAETPLFYLERELNTLAGQAQVVPVI